MVLRTWSKSNGNETNRKQTWQVLVPAEGQGKAAQESLSYCHPQQAGNIHSTDRGAGRRPLWPPGGWARPPQSCEDRQDLDHPIGKAKPRCVHTCAIQSFFSRASSLFTACHVHYRNGITGYWMPAILSNEVCNSRMDYDPSRYVLP